MASEIFETAATKEFQVANVKFADDGEAGSLRDSSAVDIECDARLKVTVGGATYYLPLYDTTV
jgi:hypothetical protein